MTMQTVDRDGTWEYWCPFARVRDIGGHSFNRFASFGDKIPEGTGCLGQVCMAWVEPVEDEAHGYCGLVPGLAKENSCPKGERGL